MTTDEPSDLFPPAAPATPPPPPPLPETPLLPADDEWSKGKQTKGVKLPVPVLVGVLAVVALAGLWGGAQLKGDNSSSASTTGAAGTGTGRRFNGGYGFPGGGGNGGGGTGGAGRFGGGVRGTVESVNGDTITVKTANGQTVTVKTGSNTTVTKTESGSVSDIASGDTLLVRGQTASDGSTTADSITIGNGAALGGFPGGAPPSDPNAASSAN